MLAVAVGPVTAGPLDAVGVPTRQPERARLGALAREVVARLPERDPVLPVGGHTLQVRGTPPSSTAGCVELAPGSHGGAARARLSPGRVVTRAELVHRCPAAATSTRSRWR